MYMCFIIISFLISVSVMAADLPSTVERSIDRYDASVAKAMRDIEKAKDSLSAALNTQRAAAVRRGDAKAAAAIDIVFSKIEEQTKNILASVNQPTPDGDGDEGPAIAANPVEKYLKGCKDQDDYDLVIYAYVNNAVPNQYLSLNFNVNHRYDEQIDIRGDWQWDGVMSNEKSFYLNTLFPGVIHKDGQQCYERPGNAAECVFANSRGISIKITDINTSKGFGELMQSARVLILSNQPHRLQVLCDCKSLVKHPTPIN